MPTFDRSVNNLIWGLIGFNLLLVSMLLLLIFVLVVINFVVVLYEGVAQFVSKFAELGDPE